VQKGEAYSCLAAASNALDRRINRVESVGGERDGESKSMDDGKIATGASGDASAFMAHTESWATTGEHSIQPAPTARLEEKGVFSSVDDVLSSEAALDQTHQEDRMIQLPQVELRVANSVFCALLDSTIAAKPYPRHRRPRAIAAFRRATASGSTSAADFWPSHIASISW